ncbi:MAG: bifunctional pyr operon transcriptional regulator/uracil phosphoribosyltransferase PyrR [Bacteroidia bacterium]|nr:bifunctional pyr operon transcriptional regulator/uracil phosphoribosyltransferase PyrR [Bacteroidia bacterium]
MNPTKMDLFPQNKLSVTLLRLAHELIEDYHTFDNTVIIGLQPRGVYLSRRMMDILRFIIPDSGIPYGELDVTFFRDDFRRREAPLQANINKIDFLLEGKKVILIDDVLYTGRTIRAALDAMLAYGRPQSVSLMVLVDRKHKRELPIEAQYRGITVDTIQSEKVLVELVESGGEDKVYLLRN